MINHRKKDYFQRILEEFFMRLNKLINRDSDSDTETSRTLLNDCFTFFKENFEVERSDSREEIIDKIKYQELIEQYARLLYTEYTILDIKYKENLFDALYLIEFLQRADSDYSWDRTILREDILRVIEQNTKD